MDNGSLIRPRGKVSIREMEKVVGKSNWYLYTNEAQDWAEENNRDLDIEQVADKDTRGYPRKYYDAEVMLDWWRDTKRSAGLKGGVEYYQKVEHRFKRFAKEKKQ